MCARVDDCSGAGKGKPGQVIFLGESVSGMISAPAPHKEEAEIIGV